eukprot:10769126-Alexandrium_andersonii.AAC.1
MALWVLQCCAVDDAHGGAGLTTIKPLAGTVHVLVLGIRWRWDDRPAGQCGNSVFAQADALPSLAHCST